MTPTQAKAAVKLLLAAYPTQRQRMSDSDVTGMTEVYATAFAKLDDAIVRAAISALVLTERWLPSVAQVVAKVADMRDGRKRAGGDAWGDVLGAMRRYGSHRTPGIDFSFADPLVARVVKAFGWGDLCASDNAAADRARFIELYDKLATEDASDRAVSGAMPGLAFKELPRGTTPVADAISNTLRVLTGGANDAKPAARATRVLSEKRSNTDDEF
jgi:hypothetical protein